MSSWDRVQNCGIYSQTSIRLAKKAAKKKARKAAKKKTTDIISGFQKELINRQTQPEILFKNTLASLNIKYEFQKIIKTNNKVYIVDFYLPEYHCIVEIDGGYHNEHDQQLKDKARSRDLKQSFIVAKIIRLTNEEAENTQAADIFLYRFLPCAQRLNINIGVIKRLQSVK